MSADNYVAVLETSDGFRVIHGQAFENLLDRMHLDGMNYNADKIAEYFMNGTYLTTRDEAMEFAHRLDEQLHTEYGVFIIDVFAPIPFSKIARVLLEI